MDLKMGSDSAVRIEASTGVGLGASDTFARPSALTHQHVEIFIPRKMKFKGWITDWTRSSFQSIVTEEVMVFNANVQKKIPGQFHQHLDWKKSRKEQGNWPTKTIVNM